jgi:hypothetical protein
MRRAVRLLAAICILFVVGAPAARAIGGQFGLEFAIDAPWRLEPIVEPDGRLTYPAIPIFVTFEDAVYEQDRGSVASQIVDKLTVGRLKEIRVIEIAASGVQTTVIAPAQLHEIERKEKVSTRTREPAHEVCRPMPGQDCAGLLDISNTHEWHAMFWYTPKAPMTPGSRLHMRVEAVTNFTLVEMRASTNPGRSGGTLSTTPVTHQLDRTWSNMLVVVAGEKPLPRFGDQWLYGDLHYHAQMSDNEGETGYAYRNVVRAMGALGIDFAFATDHASNGRQITGKIDKKYCADAAGSACFEARDLNGARFSAAKSILYGADGANEAVARDAQRFARARMASVLPQLYMGEELDAWPEMSAAERNAGAIAYGDGQSYPFSDVNDCRQRLGLAACNERYSSQYIEGDRLSYLVSDEQGIPADREIDKFFGDSPIERAIAGMAKSMARGMLEDIPDPQAKPRPSRQHIVYFPNGAAANGQGWIGSDTGVFGGASKKLADVIREIEAGGFAFLAHPLLSEKPGKEVGDDIAPAEAPYSEAALTRAWRSPAILGLEFWNENDVYKSEDLRDVPVLEDEHPSGLATVDFRYLYPWVREGMPWRWEKALEDRKNADGSAAVSTRMKLLYHGAFTWDRWLRKGLDLQQTASIPWLRRGDPRKWFMSGGSDGHGDFNFRRYGRPRCTDSRWCDKPVTDTAIGNPRNLVDLTPQPASGRPGELATDRDLNAATGGLRRYANTQVLGALRAGRFSVTDGPAIRIVVDRNRDGAVDPGDFQMGSTFDFYPGEHIPLLVEWISTVEFGPVTQIDLYVGNSATTYAPAAVTVAPGLSPLPAGSTVADRYAPDPSQALRIGVASVDGGYRGVAKVFLGPAQFGLASADGSLSYVRAVAKTVSAKEGASRTAIIEGFNRFLCPAPLTAGNKCGDRLAYSNPIWGRYRIACPPPRAIRFGQGPQAPSTSGDAPFIDADGNAVPDTCERDIPDPCPATSNTRLRGETPFSGGARPGTFQRNPNILPSGPTPGKAVPTRSCQVAGR